MKSSETPCSPPPAKSSIPACANFTNCRPWSPSLRRKNNHEDGPANQPLRFHAGSLHSFEVIRQITPLLHTPLMSLTNALDAIAVVGAIILTGEHRSTLSTILGALAIVAATSNVVGGFLITDRMLKMFKSSGPKK